MYLLALVVTAALPPAPPPTPRRPIRFAWLRRKRRSAPASRTLSVDGDRVRVSVQWEETAGARVHPGQPHEWNHGVLGDRLRRSRSRSGLRRSQPAPAVARDPPPAPAAATPTSSRSTPSPSRAWKAPPSRSRPGPSTAPSSPSAAARSSPRPHPMTSAPRTGGESGGGGSAPPPGSRIRNADGGGKGSCQVAIPSPGRPLARCRGNRPLAPRRSSASAAVGN